MSGEFINNQVFIEKKNVLENGIGNFSSKSINELLDINGDGVVDGVEMDRMMSNSVINTLESIHPLVAKAFNDENFRLETGAFLTQKQRKTRMKLDLAIKKAILKQKMIDMEKYKRVDDIQPEELNIEENSELDNNDLQEDLKHRMYLSQAEIDNQI